MVRTALIAVFPRRVLGIPPNPKPPKPPGHRGSRSRLRIDSGWMLRTMYLRTLENRLRTASPALKLEVLGCGSLNPFFWWRGGRTTAQIPGGALATVDDMNPALP